jgi:hypothetical protein
MFSRGEHTADYYFDFVLKFFSLLAAKGPAPSRATHFPPDIIGDHTGEAQG